MRGPLKHYLVEFPNDPNKKGWTLETRMPCEVGDTLFRPRPAGDGSGLVRVRVTARTEAPPPYDAKLCVEDVESSRSLD